MIADKRVWQAALAVMVLIALALPRLITAAPLDLLADVVLQGAAAEKPDENFPGSAYFFTDGLFEHAPASAANSKHVLALDVRPAAPASVFRGLTPLDSYRALNCLTSAIYYEAGNEPEEGQRAVAQVVLNRVRSPLWPHSVCGVVYQGSERTDSRCQFTFSCDGSMTRWSDLQSWTRARRIAEEALSGHVYAPVGLATFYHTLAVRPGWAASKQAVAVIGAHIFYRSPGIQGMPAAFRIPYSGREWQSGPAPRKWRAATPHPLPTPVFSQPLGLDAASLSTRATPDRQDELPTTTIRPEYRNSGRPLI